MTYGMMTLIDNIMMYDVITLIDNIMTYDMMTLIDKIMILITVLQIWSDWSQVCHSVMKDD